MNVRIGFLCLPDIDSPIGGVKQIYRHVEHLCALGFYAVVITQESSFRISWFTTSAQTLGIQEFFSSSQWDEQNSILVIPETYLYNQLSNFQGYDLKSYKYVIFNQNAYYTYGHFKSDTDACINEFYFSSNNLHTLAVSSDSCEFLIQNLGIDSKSISRIVNSVEDVFSPCPVKDNTISWMPRKNALHVNAVLSGFRVASKNLSSKWLGQALNGISHEQVAEHLNKARIFLSFGHPEGFGLPIAEAMASGCWIVGYSGQGGRELFNFGASDLIEFGDWSSFVKSTLSTIERFHNHPTETAFRLKCQSDVVKSLYSHAAERNSIRNAWDLILGKMFS